MTSPELLWVLRGIEGLILVVGALIAYLSWAAYRRTKEGSLAWLGTGFVIVSVAAAVAGIVFELLTHNLLLAWVLSASFNLVGFAAILYSIYHTQAVPAQP